MVCWKAMAAASASTALANSTRLPSPLSLTTRPPRRAAAGASRWFRCSRSRATVPLSSRPISRDDPTASAKRIAASRRCSRATGTSPFLHRIVECPGPLGNQAGWGLSRLRVNRVDFDPSAGGSALPKKAAGNVGRWRPRILQLIVGRRDPPAATWNAERDARMEFASLRSLMVAVLALAWAPHASAQDACQALADQIRRDGDPHLDTESPRTLKQALPGTFKPSPALAAALSELAGSGGDLLNLRHTGRGALHAAFTNAGSANCQNYVFFELAPDGRADEVTDPPIIVNGTDGRLMFCTGFGVWSAIGQLGGDPAFIAEIGRDQDEEVRLTPWRDHAWQQECHIAVHFTADFAVDEQYCKGIDCAMVGERARALAMQFDKDPGAFAQLPKVDDKSLALLSASEALPTFGKASRSLQGFSEDTV